MISLASTAPRLPASLSPVALYGAKAVAIRDEVLRASGVSREALTGRTQGRPAIEARQTVAYRVWTEVPSATLSSIARLIGRRDHSAAIHAILAGARARGMHAARVSDLREGDGDGVDWTKLAYAAAGWRERTAATIDAAARTAGIGRVEWRKVEQGRSVAAGTLLMACAAIGLDPLTLLAPRENTVKREACR